MNTSIKQVKWVSPTASRTHHQKILRLRAYKRCKNGCSILKERPYVTEWFLS